MKLVNLIEEDFVNYKKPGMFLGFPYCSGKCNTPGRIACQNEKLRNVPEQDLIDISIQEIIDRYWKNPIIKAFIFGGLEPFDSFDDMKELIKEIVTNNDYHMLRTKPDIVIYTGYYPWEICNKVYELMTIDHFFAYDGDVIIKFGRYIPGDESHYDPLLGVCLASDNQFALQYTWEEAGPCWNIGYC